MFETKIAIVVCEDLASWQKLNVTAFLTSGLVGASPELIGEPYRDADGNEYNALARQPVIVLAADALLLAKIHSRVLSRGVQASLYTDEMFTTGHDAANRAVVADYAAADLKIAGLALHAERRVVDKITKGAKMHP